MPVCAGPFRCPKQYLVGRAPHLAGEHFSLEIIEVLKQVFCNATHLIEGRRENVTILKLSSCNSTNQLIPCNFANFAMRWREMFAV